MINVTVYFGNKNRFTIELPETLQLGKLIGILPIVINKTIHDVLYIIICGHIVGIEPYNFNRMLGDCDLIGDKCSAHIILKVSNVEYPGLELSTSYRNIMWYNRPTNSSIQQPIQTIQSFLEGIGMVDVPVVLTESQYNDLVHLIDDRVDDNSVCTICQSQIESEGAQLTCGHQFHNECIYNWLTTSSVRCPTCNHDVRE